MFNLNSKTKAKGRYQLSVTRKDGSVEKLEFDNLITNDAISKLKQGIFRTTWMRLVYVGDGTTPATVSDTSIESQLALVADSARSTTYSVVGTGTEYVNYFTYSFAVGAVVGVVSEVGIANNNSVFCSRSLLSDVSGNPTSLSLGPYDQLTISYTLTIVIESFDFTTLITIKGVDVNCRAVSVNPGGVAGTATVWQNAEQYKCSTAYLFTESIGVISEGQSFSKSPFSSIYKTGFPYSTSENSQKVELTLNLSPSEANAMIYAIGLNHFAGYGEPIYLIIFDTPIDKTSADEFTMNNSISIDGVRL